METQSIRRSSFDTVYDANMEKVYKVAYYYSGNHHTAQDVTQTVFIKLYTNMDNINMKNVEAWLKTTAKHMALNETKADAKKVDIEELAEDIDMVIDKEVYLESLEDSLIREINEKERMEFAERIYADLYRKNKRWYEAMTITYILQRPQKEVAETMGVSLSVLQMMLYRAKKWIRKNYQNQFDHLGKV